MLASDSRRVFAIDQLESNWNQRGIIPSQVDDPQATSRQANRLVALNLQQADGVPVAPLWTLGGPPDAAVEAAGDEGAARNRRLAGHFFLGPPLPLDGRLYVITEWRQQMYLACLRVEDGQLMWQQELCAVPLPVSLDQARYYLACAPAYSDGVLVCPTHSGMLAAVDPLTGELLWSSSYDDADQQQRLAAAPYVPRTRFGHPGYPNLPLIHSGKVVYLPAHSEAICCFDLHSGKLQWRVRREDFEQAIEYVAGAEDGRVLVVGRRRCRGLSLADGAEVWSFPLTSMPAGRGSRADGSYLIPLSEGTILSLDLKTGRRTGFALPRGETRPGNLLVHGELVVSLSSHEIHAYPQAGPWLKKMGTTAGVRPAYPGQLLLAAELELAVGKSTAARQHLQDVLSNPVSPDSGKRAEHLLRELLFAEIPGASSGQPEMLQRLSQLSKTPEQAGRLLSFQSDIHRQRKNVPGLIGTARELAALNLSTPLQLDQDPARRISSATLARQILESVRVSREITPTLDRQVEADFASALAGGDLGRLRQLTSIYQGWPIAEAAQIELAKLLSRRGQDQQAELLLLGCSESRNAEVAAAATLRLIDLYNEQGLHHEAGDRLHQLSTRFTKGSGKLSRDAQAYVASYPRQHPAWEVYRRLTQPEIECRQVRIEETRWPNEPLQAVYNGAGMQFLSTPRGLGFDLFDEGRGDDGQIVAIHRHSGPEPPLRLGTLPRNDRIAGEQPPGPRIGTTISLPTRYYYPVQPQQAFVGHFFPVGSAGAAHGVSLLENRVVWTTAPPGMPSRAEIVRVGPSGPTFSVFQCRQHLFAVDPANGQLLWQRNDLETCSGLSVDPFAGLFGDERVLVLFAADRVHYTLYDTASGEELRRGRLDVNLQQIRRTFGRRLFHFTNATTGRKLRVWDPLTDQVAWQEDADQLVDVSVHAGVPAGTKVFGFVTATDELAYLTTGGRLKIVDVQRGQPCLDIPWFDPARPGGGRPRDLGFLRVFADGSRYYVNLQQVQPLGESSASTSFIISDTPLAAVHVGGELSAVDRASARVLWTREVENCSVLQFPELRLPALVTAARVRRGSQLAMRLELFHARTGETIALHDRLLADRLLQHSYNSVPKSLELRSAKATIRLDFDATSAP